jgi:hypothetical protein
MGYTIVRYRVRPESVEENRKLIAKVFEELKQAGPQAFGYAALELGDGEFVHIVQEADGVSPLPQLPAFQAFTKDHASRRLAPIDRSPAKILGNYNVLTGIEAG